MWSNTKAKLRANFRSCSFSCWETREQKKKKPCSWKDGIFLKCCCVSSLSSNCPSTEELNVRLQSSWQTPRHMLGPKPTKAPHFPASAAAIMRLPLRKRQRGWMHLFSRALQPVRGTKKNPTSSLFPVRRGFVFSPRRHIQQLAGMSPSYSLTSACKTTRSNLFASCEKCSNFSLLLSPLQAKHVLLHYVLVSEAKAADTDPV